jgi:predicted dehydrogenase
VQAVVIATATHQHKEIVLSAIDAGKHVYCEAPLAHTIEEARAIALAAKNAPGIYFQSGLQLRSDPQRHFLIPFIRSGALGKPVMARAQWNKKQSWRATSPDSDREKDMNWRLDSSLSTGLVGEIGIHLIDQAGWFFMNQLPVAVSGHGSTILWQDGRTVPDTVQLIVEYPKGARLVYHSSMASSFDSDNEVYFGTDATVMIREMTDAGQRKITSAWMFKEVDSALLGWEVYARKDSFFKETGIALVAGASKQTALGGSAAAEVAFPHSPLWYALEAFLDNSSQIITAIGYYLESGFDAKDKAGVAQAVEPVLNRQIPADVEGAARATLSVTCKAPRFDAGYVATVIAIKANEAVSRGTRIELKKEMFELT